MSFWDGIVVGDAQILGSHTFTADEIKAFAKCFDPQIFHLDEEKAKDSVLGGLCASGWHTTAVYMRLNIATQAERAKSWMAAGNPRPRFGPSPGIQNIKWPKPVYAGDTITYKQVVTGKRVSSSRPGWGVIEFSTEGKNQKGLTVLSFDAAAFLGTD